MLENYKHIYFLGIGGIGMSSLALYVLNENKVVGGYDKVKSEITDTLIISDSVSVLVVDSVAALTPKAELEGEMGDHQLGLQSRLIFFCDIFYIYFILKIVYFRLVIT